MDDLIERLRASTMGFDWSDLPDDALIPAVPLLREAATALSQEREAREKAEKRADDEKAIADAALRERDAFAEAKRKLAAQQYAHPWTVNEAAQERMRAEVAEASLAEAKRLLTKIAAPMEMRSSLWTKIGLIKAVQHFQKEAARFLSQEPNHER